MHNQMNHIDGIAFDLDGTLVDSAPDLAMSTNLYLQTLGAPMLPENTIREIMGGGINTLLHRAIAASLGYASTARMNEACLTRFSKYYLNRIFDRSTIYPGVKEGLDALRKQGKQLACVTNKASHLTMPLLEKSGLKNYFSEILCADRPEMQKPSGAMLTELANRWGLPTERILVVGDSKLDIASANDAGCPAVAVDYGYDPLETLKATRPSRLIGSIAALQNLTPDNVITAVFAPRHSETALCY